MSITFREMLGINSILDVPVAHQQSITTLLPKVNALLGAYEHTLNKHFVAIVTSGYRTWQHHVDIYKQKFYRTHDAYTPFDESTVPKSSAHLIGQAVDIADPAGKLYAYLYQHEEMLVAAGLYMERATIGWVHLQDRPTNQRIFVP